jgi:beta-phosphoglucomutase
MIQACLFDLDGVIVDTAKFHFLAWRKLANNIGLDFTETQNEALKGVSRVDSLKKILDWGHVQLDQATTEKLLKEKNDNYLEMVSNLNETNILEGVTALLVDLKANNIKIGLGSSSKNAQLILEKINLLHYFDIIIDGNNTTLAKPNPEVFLNGAKALNVPANNCLVFEDSLAGLEAANAAGMKSIGIGEPATLYIASIVVTSLNNFSYKNIAML